MKKIIRKKCFLYKNIPGYSLAETIAAVCVFSVISFSVLILTRSSFSFVNRIENICIKKEAAFKKIRNIQNELSNLYIPFYAASVSIRFSGNELLITDEKSGTVFYRTELSETLKVKSAVPEYFKDSFVSGVSLNSFSALRLMITGVAPASSAQGSYDT